MQRYAFAFALIVAAAPAFAQSGSMQSPPAPNADQSAPTPATSAPPGAMTTGVTPNVSGPVGATSSTGAALPDPASPSAAVSGTVPTPAAR